MPLANPQVLVDHLASKRQKLIGLVAVANAGVALLLCVLVYSVLSASKHSYEEQANGVAEGIAAMVQLSIAGELSRADAVMQATVEELERLKPGDAPDALVNAVLVSRLKLISGVEAFRLTDGVARVRWGNNLPSGPPVEVSDRAFFEQAKEHRDDQSIVAGPLRSRVSGNWVVAFVRPLRIDGAFGGVLYVTATADHFREMFSRYELDEGDAITLRSSDLRLVARHSPGSAATTEVGSTTVSNELRLAVQADPRSGSFVSKVASDGILRTSAYRAVEGWPFTVYAGIGHARFFKAWEQQVLQVSLLAALSWCLVALATLLMYRASLRESVAMQALADQSKRTQTLLRVAGDGIHIVDRHGMLVEMSDSFAEMLCSTREELIGKHISTWDANQNVERIGTWLASLKNKDHQRVEVQHRRQDGTIIDVELQLRVAEIGGELLIFGAGRDVTEVKRLAREQTAMLESALVGMAKVENRRFTWVNPSFELLFGYSPGELHGQLVRVVHVDDAAYEFIGRNAYEQLKTGAQRRAQLRMVKKNGDSVWVDFGAVQLNDAQILLMAVDVTAAKQAHDLLAHTAFHDPLTQLPNRLLLSDRLRQGLSIAERESKRVAVCYLDLDGFKAINDAHGHDAGDDLLKEVAQRLLANLRPSDTAARMGGDEFVLILSTVVADEWRSVLERIAVALEEPIRLKSGAVVRVSGTFGVVLSSPQESDVDILNRADQVMLDGKKKGKGRIFLG